MIETPLTCKNCEGAMALPADLAALSVQCPYCGQATLLPEALVKERLERHRQETKKAIEAERSKQAIERTREKRKHNILKIIIMVMVPLVGFLVILGYVQYTIHSTRDTRPTDPVSTGMSAAGQWLANRKAIGCTYVVTHPELKAGGFVWEAKTGSDGDCVDVVTVTGDAANRIDMVLSTPSIEKIPGKRNGAWVEIVHCGKSGGTYSVSVTSSNNNLYTFAAVACPRALYEAPPPTDPISTGEMEVAARMKRLYQKGCKHIVHPAKKVHGTVSWTPTLADTNRANCLNMLAATGILANTLILTMHTPFGEALPTPPPSTVLDYLYCPTHGGPYPITVTAAADSDYTFAAVDCPRRIARKLLKK